ncbi:MAG TPA: formate/nitrite transporter family protein [Blastocatellia bacterium]|nr:formate/nitrite transporter family protein [Blastocatellia bacterium]
MLETRAPETTKDAPAHLPELSQREKEKADEHLSASAGIIHEAIRRQGEDELSRTSSGLAWSGLAAGLSMGFSLISEGLLHSALPDAPWTPLVTKLGYAVGFLIVIIGRQQLFTENTLTPIIPLLTQRDGKTFWNVLRLWTVVFAANLVGTLIVAWVLGHTSAFDPAVRESFKTLSLKATGHGFGLSLLKGVFAGWLIALMVWMLGGLKQVSVSIIVIITYLIGIGGLTHIIAGSVEAFYLTTTGAVGWWQEISRFTVPTLIGNVVGGVSLVAVVNHAQVIASGGKRE